MAKDLKPHLRAGGGKFWQLGRRSESWRGEVRSKKTPSKGGSGKNTDLKSQGGVGGLVLELKKK